MSNAEGATSPEHQALVDRLIVWIKGEGFEITCANYDENYAPCSRKVQDYIPDVKGYAASKEQVCFGEGKTADDIDNDITKAQFDEFAYRLMPGGLSKSKRCPFYIAIPKGSEETLKKVLKELDLLDKPNVKWRSF